MLSFPWAEIHLLLRISMEKKKLCLFLLSIASILGKTGLLQNLQSFNNLVIFFPLWLHLFQRHHYSQISSVPHLHTYYLGNAGLKVIFPLIAKCAEQQGGWGRWSLMPIMEFGQQAGVQEFRSQQRCRSSVFGDLWVLR